MTGEIRGLKTGVYWSKDESCFIRISRNDTGVSIEIVDWDADIFYAFSVNEKQEMKFEWGQASPS